MFLQRSFLLAVGFIVLISGRSLAFDSHYDGRLPVHPGEPVPPRGKAPEQARLFWDKNGEGFNIYWDHLLGTPRYVSAQGARLVIADLAGEYTITEDLSRRLESAVRRFVDENSEFFGVASQELSAPSIRRIKSQWLLSFRQVLDGVAVRGANLRVILNPDGVLDSVKSFIWRERPRQSFEFAGIDATLEALSSEEKFQFDSREQEIIFMSYNPGDYAAIWEAKGLDRDLQPVEYFFEAATGKMLDKRIFAFELGLYQGGLKAICPNLDPNHSEYNFQVPGSMARKNPPLIEGAKISTDFSSNVTRSDGSFDVLGMDGKAGLRWTLLMGDCKEPTPFDPPNDHLSFCPVEKGNDFFEMKMAITSTLPNDFINSDPILVEEGTEIKLVGNEKQPSDYLSAAFMTFHHVREFLGVSEFRMEKIVGDLPSYPFLRVALEELQAGFQRLAYLPHETAPRIILSSLYERQADIFNGRQFLTPTIIKHEYAHHIIFRMTGALRSIHFDCFHLDDPFHPDPNCLDRIQDPEVRFEGSMIEGLADAVAAYQADTPLFGCYDSRGILSGSMAYDISTNDFRQTDIRRNIVAKFFWQVYVSFKLDMSLGLLSDRREDATKLLYHFIAKNHVVHGTDRIFDLSPILVDELLRSDDAPELFFNSDGDLTNGTPHKKNILAAFNGLDLVRAMFIRGDANQDQQVDLSDAIHILTYLFLGGNDLFCRDAMDVNDEENIDVTDPIYLLTSLFIGGTEIPAPFPRCDIDPTEDELFESPHTLRLSCNNFNQCP